MTTVILDLAHALTMASPVAALAALAVILLRDRPLRAGPIAVLGLLVGWYTAAATLLAAGFLDGTLGGAVPRLVLVGIPTVIALVWVLAAPAVRRFLADGASASALIGVQTYRIVGGVFLLYLALDRLPAIFAAPAGAGDVLVGLTALSVAAGLGRGRRSRTVLWNVLGLVDLAVAVTTAVAASAAFHLTLGGPTTQLLTEMPDGLVPVFMVPLSVLLHAASLRSLRRTRTATAAAAALVGGHASGAV